MPLKAKQEHVRITILRYLNETTSGFANASLMTQVLRDDACLDVDRAFVVRELNWLENKGVLSFLTLYALFVVVLEVIHLLN